MGLWQKVTLTSSGPVVLQNPLLTSELALPGAGSADLKLETTVKNLTDSPQSGVLRGSFGDTSFQAPVSLAPRESKLVKLTPQDTPQLRVLHPVGRAVLCPPHDGRAKLNPRPMHGGGQRTGRPACPGPTMTGAL
jgi:hypothetical protein